MSVMRKVLKGSLMVSGGVLAGRVLGFVREILLAHSVGVSAKADMAVVLLTAPDFLTTILIAGSFSAAFIPFFQSLESNKQRYASLLQLFIFFGGVFTLLTLFLMRFSTEIVSVLAPGFSGGTKALLAQVVAWSFWVLPLTALSGLTTAYLQSQEKFMIPAFGTVFYNIAILCALFLSGPKNLLIMLAVGVVIGAFVRLGSQWVSIESAWDKNVLLQKWVFSKKEVVRYLQAAMTGGVVIAVPTMARAFVSFDGEGSVALFNYVYKLVQLPLGVCLTTLSVVYLPILSKEIQKGRDYQRAGEHGFTLIVLAALVLTGLLYGGAHWLVSLVYGLGHLSTSHLETLGHLFQVSVIGLAAQGLSLYFTSVYNAHQETRTPLIINGACATVFLGSLLLLHHATLENVLWRMNGIYLLGCVWQAVGLSRRWGYRWMVRPRLSKAEEVL